MNSFLTTILFSSIAINISASETIKLEIYPNAQIVEVNCHTPTNYGHDIALAGSATVLTAEGKLVALRISVSRFGDTKSEANILCKELTGAKVSKKKLDVIFEENTDFENEITRDVKGVKKLHGLNPFFNG